jgi:acyl-CoA dehydrogenase
MQWGVPPHLSPRLAALRRLIADEVVPLETEAFRHGFAAVEPRLVALRARSRETGLFAPHLPRVWGGAELTLPELALVG